MTFDAPLLLWIAPGIGLLGLGLAWWALDFPFMKRYSREQVRANTELGGVDDQGGEDRRQREPGDEQGDAEAHEQLVALTRDGADLLILLLPVAIAWVLVAWRREIRLRAVLVALALTLAPRHVPPREVRLVPADGRLLESVNLRVQEAALTGESEAVSK